MRLLTTMQGLPAVACLKLLQVSSVCLQGVLLVMQVLLQGAHIQAFRLLCGQYDFIRCCIYLHSGNYSQKRCQSGNMLCLVSGK